MGHHLGEHHMDYLSLYYQSCERFVQLKEMHAEQKNTIEEQKKTIERMEKDLMVVVVALEAMADEWASECIS
jgi:hypothetical protein